MIRPVSLVQEDLYYLIYISSATELMSEEDLDHLALVCQKNNEAEEITGMLLYREGNFLQLLEGPRVGVEDLLERIREDPRHRGIEVLLKGKLTQRCFQGQSMAFQDLSNVRPEETDNHSEFFPAITSFDISHWPRKAHRLLQSFWAMQPTY